jgi:hypothetical protein
MMGSTDPRKPVRPTKVQKTRHPRKTQEWKMVFTQPRPGLMVPMWQTIERVKLEGVWTEQVMTMHPDDVHQLLQVESQRPVSQRRKITFQPWED